MLPGIYYVIDCKGKPVAVQVDLKIHGKALEFLGKLHDIRLVQSRKHEADIPWKTVKKRLKKKVG